MHAIMGRSPARRNSWHPPLIATSDPIGDNRKFVRPIPFPHSAAHAVDARETEPAMIPEQIENVKSQYTDKYVVVDGSRPELARFRDLVGQVKTVTMSGRALVEFADYHLNIGWFDIDLDYLKVVDKPAPKVEKATAKPAPAKPAAKAKPAGDGGKKLSPLEMARQQGAGGKSAAKPAAGKSTADILAAARGDAKGSAAKAESAPKESASAEPKGKMSTSDVLAAARGDAAPTAAAAPAAAAKAPPTPSAPSGESKPAKVDRSTMSVADLLAAARAEKSGGAAATPAAEPATTEEPAAETETPAPEVAESADEPTTGDVVKVDKTSMSVDEMIAYCREKDAS
jgi:hypothetical protein